MAVILVDILLRVSRRKSGGRGLEGDLGRLYPDPEMFRSRGDGTFGLPYLTPQTYMRPRNHECECEKEVKTNAGEQPDHFVPWMLLTAHLKKKTCRDGRLDMDGHPCRFHQPHRVKSRLQ